jgi:hypothetical protein
MVINNLSCHAKGKQKQKENENVSIFIQNIFCSGIHTRKKKRKMIKLEGKSDN